jgi:hypothetical protein
VSRQKNSQGFSILLFFRKKVTKKIVRYEGNFRLRKRKAKPRIKNALLAQCFPSPFLPLLLRNAQKCFRVAEIGPQASYFQKNSRDVMFPLNAL